ncbi:MULTISPECIES: PD-(D/E)XK nuclease family protein [Vibrio]|uniref:PD-(D/E)XK nuclease family protein n=1 Tax=Vibrio TaxID=662 RepID=UPI00352DBFCB
MISDITTPLLKSLAPLLNDTDYINLTRTYYSNSYLGDFITFDEKQICMMLWWFLDPKEGHRQYDYFIRQLLSAYVNNLPDDSSSSHAYELLSHTYSGARVITEFTLPNKKRIDIVVLDRNSQTLVVIERKDGSKAHDNQLSAYREWAQEHFPDWNQVYILSDSHERDHGDEFDDYYVQLNDDWLVSAIKQILTLPDISSDIRINLQNALRLIDEDFEYPIEKTWFELNKKLSQKYSQLIKLLKSTKLPIGEQSVSLLNIDPRIYLNLIAKHPELRTVPLLSVLQDNYYDLYYLSTFNEFEHFEDQLMTIAPRHIDLSLEYVKDKVNFTHQLHSITPDDFWPYYLTLARNGESPQLFDLSLHLSKKSHEEAIGYVDAMAEAYKFEPSRKKVYFERVLLTDIDDINLTKGTPLRHEIDRFFDRVKIIN